MRYLPTKCPIAVRSFPPCGAWVQLIARGCHLVLSSTITYGISSANLWNNNNNNNLFPIQYNNNTADRVEKSLVTW